MGGDSGELRRATYEYDAAGRLLAEYIDPDGLNLATRYHYGVAWNLQATEDARGNLTNYGYNNLGLRDAVTDALGQRLRGRRSRRRARSRVRSPSYAARPAR